MNKQNTEVFTADLTTHQLFTAEVTGVHEREISLMAWKDIK
jgi:hypothetical protein